MMIEPAAKPEPAPPSVGGLTKSITAAANKGPPPVHLWNPPFCGDLDMRIARDGTWFYLGTPIGRPEMVRLFASVLRHDEDGRYYLVTPVEKIGITVDDAPFVAQDFHAEGAGRAARLTFTANVGDEVEAGPEHPIRVVRDPQTGEPSPYIHIRARLEALIDRKTFYRLVDLGETCEIGGQSWFGVWSNGEFFPFAPSEDLEETL